MQLISNYKLQNDIIKTIANRGGNMHTIQLKIQDDVYDELLSKGIDINYKLQDFLNSLADDGYPSISADEAKQRVADAVNRYRDGNGTYINNDEYIEHKTNMIDSIKSKYANN